MKKKLVAAALIGSLLSAPAFAWSDREQGILSGIAGYWIFQKLNERQQPPVVVEHSPRPVYGPLSDNPRPPVIIGANCKQVMGITFDRYGNQYQQLVTVCQ